MKFKIVAMTEDGLWTHLVLLYGSESGWANMAESKAKPMLFEFWEAYHIIDKIRYWWYPLKIVAV